MTFNQFDKAIDTAMEYGLEEEKATNLVGDICDIFELRPEESEDDVLMLMLAKMFE